MELLNYSVDSTSYSLSNQFNTATAPVGSSRLTTFELGDAANEQLILKKLGTAGWGRLHYFRMCFSAGWGEGNQNPLSPRSLEMFGKALRIIEFPENVKPSIFLTDDGFIELTWRDCDGNAIQFEFRSKDFEIYIEACGVEAIFPNDELEDVVRLHLGA